MRDWFDSLGPAGPLAVLFLGGLLCAAGSLLGWRWLYPGRGMTRYWSEGARRVALFFIGLTVMAAAIIFYIFRDHMNFS